MVMDGDDGLDAADQDDEACDDDATGLVSAIPHTYLLHTCLPNYILATHAYHALYRRHTCVRTYVGICNMYGISPAYMNLRS